MSDNTFGLLLFGGIGLYIYLIRVVLRARKKLRDRPVDPNARPKAIPVKFIIATIVLAIPIWIIVLTH